MRVIFDERPPRRYVGAHEGFEYLAGFERVVDRDALEHAGLRVHRGFPQLLGVHLPEAFEALDLVAPALVLPQELLESGFVVDVLEVLLPAEANTVKRWLGDVDVTGVDARPHEIGRASCRGREEGRDG